MPDSYIDPLQAPTPTPQTKQALASQLDALDAQCIAAEKRVRSIMRGRIATSLFGVLLFTSLFGVFTYDSIYGRQQNIPTAVVVSLSAIPIVGFLVTLFIVNALNSRRLKYWYRRWNRFFYIRDGSGPSQYTRTGLAMDAVKQGATALNPGLGLGINDRSRGDLLVSAYISADAAFGPRPSGSKGVFIEEYFELRAKRDAFAAMSKQ